MKLRLKYLATILALISLKAQGQTLTGDVLKLRSKAAPSICVIGELRFDSASNVLKTCRDGTFVSLLDSTTAVTTASTSGTADYSLTSGTASFATTAGALSGGVLSIAQGGTNNGTLAVTAGGVLFTDGTKVMNTGVGTAAQVLTSNGGASPTWQDIPPAGANTSLTNLTGIGATLLPDSNNFWDLGGSGAQWNIIWANEFRGGGPFTLNALGGDVNVGVSSTIGASLAIRDTDAIGAIPVRFYAADSTSYIGLRAGATASNTDYVLPQADGTNGFFLKTNGAGTMSWAAAFTAPITIAQGGTNNTALSTTAGGVLYMDGSKAMNTGAGTQDQVLISNGASAPSWKTYTKPTVTTYLSGSGTYTTPVGVYWLRLRMVGGGGSGGTLAADGTAGSASYFNSSAQASFGGSGAGSGGSPSAGGTASGCTFNFVGGGGQGGGTSTNAPGGQGGSSVFGGGGSGGVFGGAGQNASPNTGAGGGGGSVSNASRAGGAAGGYCEHIYRTPAATYTYTVGAGGPAPTNAGAGAAGIIIIEEYYQ